MSDFTTRVHDAVRSVPSGRVASYGAIAELAGRPGAARAVGAILRALDEQDVPWWRVINGRGQLSIPRIHHGRKLQKTLLEEEGVGVSESGRVDMRRYGWPGTEVD